MKIEDIHKKAKKMKLRPTFHEKALAKKLREWKIRYISQFVIEWYIPDFYLPQYRIIIEVDGAHHYRTKRKNKDEKRTVFLEARGFKVIRIPNFQVKDLTKENLMALIIGVEKEPDIKDRNFTQNYLQTLS